MCREPGWEPRVAEPVSPPFPNASHFICGSGRLLADAGTIGVRRGSMSKTCSFCGMPADEDGRLYVQCTCKNVNGDVPPDEAWEQQNKLYLGKFHPLSAIRVLVPAENLRADHRVVRRGGCLGEWWVQLPFRLRLGTDVGRKYVDSQQLLNKQVKSTLVVFSYAKHGR